jgi:hypothetical protein
MAPKIDCRSNPVSGHYQADPVGPFGANTGLMRRSKNSAPFRPPTTVKDVTDLPVGAW